MDIWLLPAVGRRARRASRHPAEPQPPPARLFGTFLFQDSLPPQQEELAGPLGFSSACFCLVFVRFLFFSNFWQKPRRRDALGQGVVAAMGCCKNPNWSLQNSSGLRQLCERNLTGRTEHGPLLLSPLHPKSLLTLAISHTLLQAQGCSIIFICLLMALVKFQRHVSIFFYKSKPAFLCEGREP